MARTLTPLENDAARVYATLRTGGLALVPTDVGYGLLAVGEGAVDRIYELKGRPLAKPCVTVANRAILADIARPLEAATIDFIEAIRRRSPLAVVVHLEERSCLLASMDPGVRAQATHEGTLAAFFSAGPLVEAVADLALADGRLVVGSSANLSGTGNNGTFAEVPECMVRGADLALNRGPVRYASPEKLPATILNLTTGAFQRRGVDFPEIERRWLAHRFIQRCLRDEALSA